ncbi:hypothetical protein ACF1AE_07305 [Streptomyces sp. NPDC014986]|uniref:hypothetical protein n=1 Tax=Streptomyces sp. NPDC014986 TaxID=3364934 RepID=UPI0036FFCC67
MSPATAHGTAPDTAAPFAAQVARAVAGRRCVLAGMSPARLVPRVTQLLELGAAGVFALSARPDSAPAAGRPASARMVWWDAGLASGDQDTLAAEFTRLLSRPTPELAARLDAFDPDRSALVLDTLDTDGAELLHRRRYGHRRPRWTVAEDKVRVHEVWERAGIAAAPETVVPCEPGALAEAVRGLGTAGGTVWAADARDGIHTGARGTRHHPPGADTSALAAEFAGRADRVRVMPFLDGLPCSIHGLVVPGSDAVPVFRPLELLTLRRPDGAFVFAGTSTYWDCPAPRGAELRATARAVGRALRELYGYRGAFTLDGVLTADGFLPTEVNARLGSGLNIDSTRPELAFDLLCRVLREGDPVDVAPALLESTVLDALDRVRHSEAKIRLDAPAEPGLRLALLLGPDGTLRPAGRHDRPDATLRTERSAVGDRVRFQPRTDAFRGHALGSALAGACALGVRELGLRITPLTACVPPAVPGSGATA